jgi:Fusaric acid resistance protein-like
VRKILSYARDLHSMGPANNDRLSAVRVALSVAVPALTLLAIGRPELTLYAVFGGLTAMYGRNESHQLRLKHQLQAAVVLLGGVTVGTFLAVNHVHSWGLVAVEALLAGVGSLYSDRVRLKPNGPFFGILALGACASIPVNVPFGVAVLIAAASAAFSLLVGFAGWLRVRAWESGASREAPARTPESRQAAVVHAARYITAVGVAGSIGVLSGSGYPHWAMAAAAVPLAGADMPSAVHRGIHRIVGTLLGLGIVAVVLFPGPASPLQYLPTTVVLVLLVIACQFFTELFMTRHYGWAMVFFTPVILLMTELAAPVDPGRLVTERAAETLIGALTGIAVVLIIRARKGPGGASAADLP